MLSSFFRFSPNGAWFRVKYGGKTKRIQRFCNDIKPIIADIKDKSYAHNYTKHIISKILCQWKTLYHGTFVNHRTCRIIC